jgi:hypothetical protein
MHFHADQAHPDHGPGFQELLIIVLPKTILNNELPRSRAARYLEGIFQIPMQSIEEFFD